MSITNTIRGYGDRDSVIVKANKYEVLNTQVIIYQVLTTSPLSEGPVRDVHNWRYISESVKHSNDYATPEQAMEAYGKFIKGNQLKETTSQLIKRIIKEELSRGKLSEGSADYEVYHYTYSSAVQEARAWAISRGYEISDVEWFNNVSTGPARPRGGKTNRLRLELTKYGKVQRKYLQIQVYNRGVPGNTYELNAYIN